MPAPLRLVSFALLLAVTGCDDPLAFREPPAIPRQLTIMAVLDPDRTSQHVHVEPLDAELPLTNIRGRLYEDGELVATDLVPSVDRSNARLQRCAENFGGMVAIRAGTCLEFTWWPRNGSTYRIEVEADGVETAVGETRVPAAFQLLSVHASGSPPGSGGLSAEWTASADAHTYVVAVRSEQPPCGGAGCRTGWYAETTRTEIEETVPAADLEEGTAPYVVEVLALNRSVYEYLTTGASGDLFPVPPVENVAGGRGVVGSWVRRSARQRGAGWTPDPVITRGDWDVVPWPDDYAVLQITLLAGGRVGMVARGDRGLHYAAVPGLSWSRVFTPGPSRVEGTGPVAFFSSEFSLYRFAPASEPAVHAVASFESMPATLHASEADGLLLVTLQGDTQRLLRSADGGASFEPIGLPAVSEGPYTVTSLAEDPAAGTLYAGVRVSPRTGGTATPVLRSDDRGTTWKVAGSLPGDPWRVDARGGRVYAAVHDGDTGLFLSNDGGGTWTEVLDAPATSLHLGSDGRVWVGALPADGQILGENEGGVFVSADGVSYRPFGLANAYVEDLVASDAWDTLYVSTRERGLLRQSTEGHP